MRSRFSLLELFLFGSCRNEEPDVCLTGCPDNSNRVAINDNLVLVDIVARYGQELWMAI